MKTTSANTSRTQLLSCSPAPLSRRRRGYTLVELLITVSIIAIMASMVLFAVFAAQEQARAQKTRALIAKLDNIIRARYESYRTRRVPFRLPPDEFIDAPPLNGVWDVGETLTLDWNGNGEWDPNPGPIISARMRMDILRDLMRMEMPDRWSDVYDNPAAPLPPWMGQTIARPSVSHAYLNKWRQVTGQTGRDQSKEEYQGAECLYMIVMEAVAAEGDARDVFRPDHIGDVDSDGFPEFVDAWGTPIRFLRWAPGFISEVQNPVRGIVTTFTPNGQTAIIEAPAGAFPQSPGTYIGGALATLDPMASREWINRDRLARITDYNYDDMGTANDRTDDEVTFTCETPASTMQQPFAVPPELDDAFLVMPRDPFDPIGSYPVYPPGAMFLPGEPDISTPTFALYPLIYSAGPDKAYGIVADVDDVLNYADELDEALNPFYVPQTPGREMMGTLQVSSREPDFYEGCWLDNIHNHQVQTR